MSNETLEDEVVEYRIRKLTPRECFRLMDFPDEAFDKASQVNSSTQLYKQAGNSIVRNCLVAVMGQLFEGKENVYREINIDVDVDKLNEDGWKLRGGSDA